jgi:hypothetical protein
MDIKTIINTMRNDDNDDNDDNDTVDAKIE